MISVSFDGCVGRFHEAPGGRGVIVVPAHGFEELCTRHAMRLLADRLAASGLPTLRLELHGCGDAAGSDLDPHRIPTWIGNIKAAIDWMMDETGVQDVALVGVRLGALLALQAACERPVARVALLAPPTSGAGYLREMKVLSQVLSPRSEPVAAVDGLEIAGFRVTSATMADLKDLDRRSLETCPAPEILVLAPETGRGAAQLVTRLEALGSAVRQEPFRGFQQMMVDPTASVVPAAAIERVGGWLESDAPPVPRAVAPIGANPLRSRNWNEDAVALGDGASLAGVLCRPVNPATDRPAVIFVNAGGIPHTGWARMYVGMARRLAEAGIVSLRFDLTGIGDSAPWQGQGRQTFYEPGGTQGVRAAIDLLAARGVSRIMLVGGCSGAHHAFHAGLADARVEGLVLFNLVCFVWGPQYAIPLNAWRMALPREIECRKREADEDGTDRGTVLDRVIDGVRPTLKASARTMFELVKTISGPLRRLATAHRRAANPIEAAFRAMSGRGVRIRLVYSENDPGRTELERYMGPEGSRATALAHVDLHLLPGADHALTPTDARERLSDLLMEAVVSSAAVVPVPNEPSETLRREAA